MEWFHLIAQGEQIMATYTILNSIAKDICRKINRITKKCEKNQIPYTFSLGDPYTKRLLVLMVINLKSVSLILILTLHLNSMVGVHLA